MCEIEIKWDPRIAGYGDGYFQHYMGLTSEFVEWAEHHIKPFVWYDYVNHDDYTMLRFNFHNERDALMFKLAWVNA